MKSKIMMLIAAMTLVGCGHMKKGKHEGCASCGMDKKAQPAAPPSSSQINMDAFMNSPDLTAAQKEQLKSIFVRTMGQSRALSADLAEAKSKMFQTLASRDYKSKDITSLKKEISTIDQKRLDLMFSALSEVQGVVGYGADKEKIYKQLRDYDLYHGDRLSNIQ
ncbi:MAG: Spy/CpxP family protein refolding chaperone [Bdellovibrionales bacterium]